jgi:hypothetical protein
MARYRTKPFEINAIQFTGDNFDAVQRFCGEHCVDAHSGWWIENFQRAGTYRDWSGTPEIAAEVWDKLHHTWVGVRVNDFIIHGSEGENYPCDPEVFNRKYELV